jgi:energy-converting hydrogenase Eha subunit C
MLHGVICEVLSQLCTLSNQAAVNFNGLKSPLQLSGDIIMWVICGLIISLLSGLAFAFVTRTELLSGTGGLVMIFAAVGLVILQGNELAYRVIIKFVSISVMAVFREDDLEDIMKVGLLASAGFLMLIVHTRYQNVAFPALVTDVAVASGGLMLLRAVRYLPSLIPFIILGIVILVLRNHGMGADVLTEFGEKVMALVGIMP